MVLLVDLEARTVEECVERDTGHTLLGNGRRIRRAATDQQDDGLCGKGGKLWWCSISRSSHSIRHIYTSRG